MKCPDCQFTCSDLRDICPKCRKDLRDFKNSIGLPISNPKKTYDELTKNIRSPKTTREKEIEPHSLLDTLRDLFQDQETGKLDVETPEEIILDSLQAREEAVAQMEKQHPLNSWISGAPFPVEKENGSIYLREPRFPSLTVQPLQVESKPRQAPIEHIPQHTDLTTFFQQAAQHLPLMDDMSFEITATAAIPEEDSERIQLLFQLASESFIDERIDKRLSAEGLSSTKRKVVSEKANEQLKKAEDALKAPVFTLKDAPQTLSGNRKEKEKTTFYELATTRERLAAWGYDIIMMLGLAIVTGIIFSYWENPAATTLILRINSPLYPMAVHYLMGNIFTTTLIIFLTYPIFGSFGARFSHCNLLRSNRSRPSSFGPLYLRHLLLPITSILSIAGCYPSFLKGHSIADILSNTAFCSEERSINE